MIARTHRSMAFLHSLVGHTGDECVLWPFKAVTNGYGALKIGGRAGYTVQAHRQICIMVRGNPVGDRTDAAHTCGVRLCCNPNHIRWATRAENMADKLRHGTHARAERSPVAKQTNQQAIFIACDPRPYSEIAAEYGCSIQSVCGIKKGRQFSSATGIDGSTRHAHKRRFTDEQITAIAYDKRPLAEIARTYKCSEVYVSNIRRGRYFSEITGVARMSPKWKKRIRRA